MDRTLQRRDGGKETRRNESGSLKLVKGETKMSRYISVVETAKLIRAQLAKQFPGIKFSVKSKKYAGGASIDIGWVDGPIAKQVEEVVSGYKGAGFDGMIDMKYHSESWLMPDGSAVFAKTTGTAGSRGMVESEQTLQPSFKAEKVHFGADYIFCNRKHSPAMWHRALESVCRKWGVDPSKVEIKDGHFGPYIANAFAVKVENSNYDIGSLVHQDLARRTNYLPAA
jgi:hypothetical protein